MVQSDGKGMAHNYFIVVLASLMAVLLGLLGYFVSLKPEQNTLSTPVPTQYEYQTVSGAIQPIPIIQSIDKDWVKLGKALFNSPLLSKDNTVACATCHNVNEGGDDGFPVSVGIKGGVGTRNSPTVLNAVFNFRQFWDGRSPDLSDQVLGPIHNPIEMGSNFEEIIVKLNQVPEFVQSFRALSPEGITEQAIVKAIVTFEESLITPNSPIDQYLLGNLTALSVQQKRGFEKFKSFGCISCHQGRNIGGNLYQRIGRINEVPKKLLNDEGRFSLTQHEYDRFVFKVPTLRNITKTAPYFHNGSVPTLEEAVRIMAKGQLGIDLSEKDVADLISLFDAFEGNIPSIKNNGAKP